MNNNPEVEKAKKTTATIANAVSLVAAVALEVVGNDVSDTINGTRIGTEMLSGIVQARIKKNHNLA